MSLPLNNSAKEIDANRMPAIGSDEELLLLVVLSGWLWLWKGWKAIDQASCWNETAATFFDDDVMMMDGSREKEEAEGTAVPFLFYMRSRKIIGIQW